MQSSLQNFTVLVTGTNRGLGKALALQMLEKIPDGKFLFTTRKSPE
jgi:NAD(P)-dependent dehydrogenase (short-subunit alcohol dehydrogenase family)